MKRSYRIAISGISAALTIISLLLAMFLPTAKVAFFVISALCVSLPLTQGLFWSALASYVVASAVGFLAGNIKALPFILFFGLYSLVAWLLDFRFYTTRLPRAVKIILITVIKLAYFALAFWACYKLMGVVISDIVIGTLRLNTPIFWAVGLVLFCAYDPLFRVTFQLVSRRVGKVIRRSEPSQTDQENIDDLFD
ncbi:MAG: hypothetical protein ACI4M5_05055 [Christensenellales bacterium]